MEKRTIRLRFVDFSADGALQAPLLALLSRRYHVDQEAPPDYVFHSVFGTSVLRHPCVRIFFTGENARPDFNLSDYALTFDRLTFGDRHHRLPLYRLYSAYDRLLQPRPPAAELLRSKPEFCAFVCGNADGAPERRALFELLGRYQRVASGGSYLNNVGACVPDKLPFQSRARFVLACENASAPGYITEKIVHALAAHAVPVYWGAPDVAQDFNPACFVNCHDYPSLEAAAARVAEIDRDETLWGAMVSAPCFRDNREPAGLSEHEILDYLGHIFDQPLPQAFRRTRIGWALRHEQQLDRAFHHPGLLWKHQLGQRLRRRPKRKGLGVEGLLP